MTSRWVVEAAPRKDVPVRWRTFSLAIKNAGAEIPEQFRALSQASLGALRVVEAVWAAEGDGPIGALYTAIGERFHLQGDKTLGALGPALTACSLDPALASAADDPSWDDVIRGSMADAFAAVGTDVGVPILAFHDGAEIFALSGPVMSPAATGPGALDLWDHVVALARIGNFFELKRSRTTGPQLGRPDR